MIDRRGFLASVATGWCAASARGDADEAEKARNDALRALLRQADLGSIMTTATSHYLIGSDEPKHARLRLAAQFEAFSRDAWKTFRLLRPGLKVPRRKFVVLFLGDAENYARFTKVRGTSPTIKGWYACDLAMIFMTHEVTQGDPELDSTQAGWSLRHEGTHQITYECGLLNPSGDHPPCVVEGLATIGEPELRGGASHSPPVHPGYLDWLLHTPQTLRDRISIDVLFRDDGWPSRIQDVDTRSYGYARSWLLMHLLMTDPKLRPRFDTYLSAIFPSTDSSRRIEDVEAHLGTLDDLETRMNQHLRVLASRPVPRFDSPRRFSGA